MKRLVRRLNQPMTARLIKTARSLKIPQEIEGFFPLQHFRVGSLTWLSEEHEGVISLVKRCHMMYHVKNCKRCKGEEWTAWTEYFDSRKIEQFVCNLILICTGKAFRISTINLKILIFFSKSSSPNLALSVLK